MTSIASPLPFPGVDQDNRISPEGLDAHWMAYTGNRQFKQDPRIIVGAEGIYFYDQNGRKIMDGLSGLWTCGLGHNRREIADAVSTQLRTLDYAPGFQYGQPKSFQLAERLRRLMPDDLDHVFFTGSGSEAADTSLKMARAYWRLKGQPSKTKLIGRIKGYHGVTGTPAKNAMLVRRRRRADRQGSTASSPGGRELKRTQGALGTGFAFSVNEPSTLHLHATHMQSPAFNAMMMRKTTDDSKSPEHVRSTNEIMPTPRAEGEADGSRNKTASF